MELNEILIEFEDGCIGLPEAKQQIITWCLSKLPKEKETHKELVRQVIKVDADEYWYEGYNQAITEAKRNMEGKDD